MILWGRIDPFMFCDVFWEKVSLTGMLEGSKKKNRIKNNKQKTTTNRKSKKTKMKQKKEKKTHTLCV
jgi:hypothetical protein